MSIFRVLLWCFYIVSFTRSQNNDTQHIIQVTEDLADDISYSNVSSTFNNSGIIKFEDVDKGEQEVLLKDNVAKNITGKSDEKQEKSFRPSPPLDTQYEFNKFPVIPAVAEAKNSGFDPIGNNFWKPGNIWHTTSKTPITFPKPTITNDYYPPRYPEFISNSSTRTSNFENSVIPKRNSYTNQKTAFTYNTNFEKDLPTNKYNVDREVMEKTYGSPYKPYFDIRNTYSAVNTLPWMKVIKFLAAFIPLSLVLTALKPTIINVSPLNDTINRRRSEENLDYLTKNLMNSVKYMKELNITKCEERIICEMLLGASSLQHVDTLLQTFTDRQNDVSKKISSLERVMQAVKKGDCKTLQCENVKS